MSTLLHDLKYAARRLARAPGFTLAAVAILTVGIGANTAAFSAVDALLFRPAPYANPEEVVSVYQDDDDGEPSSTDYPAYRDIATATDVFAGVAAVSPEVATWETASGPEPAAIEYATASYLPVLGLEPSRGRWFEPAMDQVGAGLYAVVTHHAWRTRLVADPNVVGTTIRLNGQPVTVIGVGPERFNGMAGALATDFWVSISSTPVGGPFRVSNLDRREDHWYDVKARLAPGVSIERARAAMQAMALRMGEANPDLDQGRGISVFSGDEVRLHPSVDGALFGVGAGILILVGLVLVLACSNLGNLILVRGESRTGEMAVRQALGASRTSLARLFLSEALLITLLGWVFGLVVARGAVALFPRLPLPLPGGTTLDLAVDGRVMLFGLALALAAAVVFGLAPMLYSRRADVTGKINEQGRSSSGGTRTRLLRQTLVVVQVAVSLVLLMGAGLITRSTASLRSTSPGFETAGLAVLSTDLSQGGVPQAELPVVRDQLLARIAAVPGVSGVSLATRLPIQSAGTTTTVIEDYTPETGTGAVELPFSVVGPTYFRTLGLPVLEGRGFGPEDEANAPATAVVNETAARRFWGGAANAVGKRLRPQNAPDAWRTVVGVVPDTKVSSLGEQPTAMFYRSSGQVGAAAFSLVVRTEGDPAALLQPMRAALREVGPALPVQRLATMDDYMATTLAGPRAAEVMLGGFSLIALVLATLGVYAMVSFSVAGRASEMGIRVAMGAARSRLVGMVVGESLVPVAVGLIIGLGAAWAVAPMIGGLLHGVDSRDPVTLAGAVALLASIAAAASWIPAWRASRADPVDALRAS